MSCRVAACLDYTTVTEASVALCSSWGKLCRVLITLDVGGSADHSGFGGVNDVVHISLQLDGNVHITITVSGQCDAGAYPGAVMAVVCSTISASRYFLVFDHELNNHIVSEMGFRAL